MNSNGDQKFNKMLGQNTNYLVQTLQPSIAHCIFRDVKYQGTYKSLKGHTLCALVFHYFLFAHQSFHLYEQKSLTRTRLIHEGIFKCMLKFISSTQWKHFWQNQKTNLNRVAKYQKVTKIIHNNLRIGSKLYQNIKFTPQLGLKFQIWSKPSTSSN